MEFNIDPKTRLPIVPDLTPKHKDKTTGVHGAGTASLLNSGSLLSVASTAQFDKSDTALSSVTGLSLTLGAPSTYILYAGLFVNADISGGQKYTLDGTVAGTIKYQMNGYNVDTAQLVFSSRLTALASTAGGSNLGLTFFTEIEGVITVGTSGTINVQFAQQAVSGTSSVLTNSYFKAVKL